jgi:hypothetical protein
MGWLDDVIAHLGEPTSSSGGTNEHGSTCYVQWSTRAEVIVNNSGRRFQVDISARTADGHSRIGFARTGEPTDRQMRDLCVFAGLLPTSALDGAR